MEFTYRIRKTFWVQRPLLHFEERKIMRICGEELARIPIEEEAIAAAIERLYKDGKIGEIFDIILKPAKMGNRVSTIVNRIRIRFKRHKPEALVDFMPRADIAAVLRDFFICWGAWRSDLLSSQTHFRWSMRKLTTLLEGWMPRKSTTSSATGTP